MPANLRKFQTLGCLSFVLLSFGSLSSGALSAESLSCGFLSFGCLRFGFVSLGCLSASHAVVTYVGPWDVAYKLSKPCSADWCTAQHITELCQSWLWLPTGVHWNLEPTAVSWNHLAWNLKSYGPWLPGRIGLITSNDSHHPLSSLCKLTATYCIQENITNSCQDMLSRGLGYAYIYICICICINIYTYLTLCIYM
jgi:hypothetical protein